MSRCEGGLHGLGVNDGTKGDVDDPDSLLALGDTLGVEKVEGSLVERAVDGDNVATGKHVLEDGDTLTSDGSGELGGEGVVVEVEELLAVEGLQALEDTVSDSTNSDSSDNLTLEVVSERKRGERKGQRRSSSRQSRDGYSRVASDLGDVPATGSDLLVGGDKVADEDEDGHEDVLGDGDDVGSSDLVDTDLVLVGSDEVNVVGTDSSSDAGLELGGLGEEGGGEVTRVEGGGDEDVGVDDLALESAVGTLLVRGDNNSVSLRLEPLGNSW